MSFEMKNEKNEKNDEMDEFERRLMLRMRPVNAPESLARALAIAAEAQDVRRQNGRWSAWFKPSNSGGVLAWPRPMAWTGAAMAAVMLLAVFVGEQVHVRREHEQATQEFEAASQITDRTLEHTREQLERKGIRLEP